MINRRDALNIASQILVKLVSIPYGLLVVALAVRRLPADESYLLLSVGNFISLPGLLQLGMGYFIQREVMNAWARDRHLDELPMVRAGFLTIFAISLIAIAIAATSAAAGILPSLLLPVILVSLLAQWAIVADYVRLARGEILKSNLLFLCGTTACAALVAWALTHNPPPVGLVIFGALAPPFLASLSSFALLMSDTEFRRMVSPRGTLQFRVLIYKSIPMFLNSVAFSLMLVIPIAAPILPWIPPLHFAALACLRLSTSVIYLYYFALQPIAPIFLRAWYGNDPQKLTYAATKLLGLLVILCLLGGAFFAAVAPPFVIIWLHGVIVPARTSIEWGAIVALSLIVMTAVFFCQNTSRPVRAAACLLITDLIAIVGPALGLSIEHAMIAGLTVGGLYGWASLILAVRQQIAVLATSVRQQTHLSG